MSKATRGRSTKPAAPITQNRAALGMKLQIAAGVFVPMLALGLWLNSQGFFG